MAELKANVAGTGEESSCCSNEAKETCCEAEAKSECCGPESSSCGCSAATG